MAVKTVVRKSLSSVQRTAHQVVHAILLQSKIRRIRRHIDPARISAVKADKGFMRSSEAFLRRHFPPRRDLSWHVAYAAASGIRDAMYIPENAFYLHLEPRVNPRATALLYSDKNMYDNLFAGAAAPTTLGRIINGRFFSKDYQLISAAELLEELRSSGDHVVVKPSVESGGGRNVQILTPGQLEGFLTDGLGASTGKNLLFQKLLRQHEALAGFHPASLNTLRIVTFWLRRGVVVISAVLRMGVKNAQVDNQAAGGISCGVAEDGRLKRFAYDKHFRQYSEHPTTRRAFAGFKVPSYAEACSLAVSLHRRLPACGMVSWDVAIDTEGSPVLIESNLRYQEINFLQLNNGPLFGRHTDEVLSMM